jgi:hypothetical protein
MARKIILKEDGLAGSGNSPSGYSYLGKNGSTLSEKIGATVSEVGGQSNTFINLVDISTISWDYSSGINAKVTLGGNRNLSITGATNGDYGTLIITQDGNTPRRINFGVNDNFASATYSFSSGTSSVDIYTFVYDGSQFYWNFNKNFS